jgi:Fungal specific transcription factor domain
VTDTFGLAGAHWTMDPYRISPLTMEYLNLYFAHINQATYYMLPKAPFMTWVRDFPDKSFDDKMILYTLMAMGCRFSGHTESIAHGKKFLQIARHAEQSSFGRFTLQLVQTRLVLALLHFSLGNCSEAWDYCGTAVRAVCGLKYNTEDGVTEEPHADCDYGLNTKTLAECRRRTFWSAYVMDVSLLH